MAPPPRPVTLRTSLSAALGAPSPLLASLRLASPRRVAPRPATPRRPRPATARRAAATSPSLNSLFFCPSPFVARPRLRGAFYRPSVPKRLIVGSWTIPLQSPNTLLRALVPHPLRLVDERSSDPPPPPPSPNLRILGAVNSRHFFFFLFFLTSKWSARIV